MAIEIQNLILSLFPWLTSHGIRIILILFSAILLNGLLKSFFTQKSFGFPVFEKALKEQIRGKITGEQQKRAQTIINVLGGSLTFIIYAVALLMVLPEFGVNIAPILAGLGLAGLAVGMAAKDILTDFIAGFFILFEDQYRIGDKVIISGIEGTVKEITLRRTSLETEDGTIHLIPNREVKIIARKNHK